MSGVRHEISYKIRQDKIDKIRLREERKLGRHTRPECSCHGEVATESTHTSGNETSRVRDVPRGSGLCSVKADKVVKGVQEGNDC